MQCFYLSINLSSSGKKKGHVVKQLCVTMELFVGKLISHWLYVNIPASPLAGTRYFLAN